MMLTRTGKKSLFLVLFTCGIYWFSQPAWATLVRPQNISDLMEAQYAVKITITDKTVDYDENNVLVSYYTGEILDCIQCPENSPRELVFKQIFQGEQVDGQGRVYRRNYYFPEYIVGRTYVIFLSSPSERTGMTAPVGLDQGVFEVVNQNGREIIPGLTRRMVQLRQGVSSRVLTRFLSSSQNQNIPEDSYEALKNLSESVKGER